MALMFLFSWTRQAGRRLGDGRHHIFPSLWYAIQSFAAVTYTHIDYSVPGYTPFDRDTQQEEMEAILAGDYKFEPEEYWMNVSEVARDFVRQCLTIDPAKRPTAAQMLGHKWLADDQPHFVSDSNGAPTNLLPYIQERFDAKKKCMWSFRVSVFLSIYAPRS